MRPQAARFGLMFHRHRAEPEHAMLRRTSAVLAAHVLWSSPLEKVESATLASGHVNGENKPNTRLRRLDRAQGEYRAV